MAIDAPSSPSVSPWPDRLRHSAVILVAAAWRCRSWSLLGELSPLRAVAVFLCIAAAALVPWRLHDAAASREDVRRVNPVESAAVGRRRRRHAGSRRAARPRRPRHPSQRRRRPARAGAAQERARAVRAALAGDHHGAARGDRDLRAAARDLSRPRAGRSLDGADHHAGAGADHASAAPTNAC